MPIVSATELSLVDIFFLTVIVLGLPLETLLNLKKGRAELASGVPGVRVKHYSQTIYMLWGISLPLLVFWAVSERSWADLGFALETGWLAYTGRGLAGLIAAFFVYQHSLVARSAETRQQFQSGLAKNTLMTNFMPQTDEERRVFNILGVTAGITEEIIFRAFLIWAFAWFMPIWAAAGAALLVFTLLHLYQGANQLPAVFAMGGLITLVFVLSGSIWPAIALHIFVDVINNSTVWKARTLSTA
ncbi:MAG: type II CAAX endopeptidase family protein [Pseudomonadota bacterium]